MNGSFTSYLTKGKPDVRPERRTYVMLHHMKARDDVKEYWGFYLLRGSTVTISTCARWVLTSAGRHGTPILRKQLRSTNEAI